ncbi:MAG TPA: metallophosphoesterase, partial [Pseudomonadales bacterium]|nr:metallophosphoesterase [Pseudomonadales bacterium]
MNRTSRALEATRRPPGRAPADAGGRSGATRLPFADLPPRILLLIVLLATTGCATASADGDDEHRDGHSFSGVERIVAIGDIHGDWDGYIATLQAAGLIDDRDRWSGGETHLVQTGDLADRGPDTRRIIEHMAQLARQARRAGGRVHNLMGNHEAMNVYGDLRYVTPGEFEAWADRRSARLRDRYYDELMTRMRENDPEAFEALPDNYREQWNAEHPEGWLEHRYAWSPLWDDDGPMYEWVRDQRVAVRINDLVFLHGGISTAYCRDALSDWTERAQDALDARSQEELDILVDPLGPLWYRGLSGVEPTASMAAVEAILARYEANHIVVGHTPTGGVIWPRYGGRVIQIDTGIGAHYGGHIGYLEITDQGRFAGYRNGTIRLPRIDAARDDYVREVRELLGDPPQLAER